MIAINETAENPISAELISFVLSPEFFICISISVSFFVLRSIKIKLPKDIVQPFNLISLVGLLIFFFTLSLDDFFWAIALYEVALRLHIESTGTVPQYHMGSLDGTVIWTLLLKTASDSQMMLFTPIKTFQMTSMMISLLTGWEWVAAGAHYIRRAHLVYFLLRGEAPMLLYVPDACIFAGFIAWYFISKYHFKPKEIPFNVRSPHVHPKVSFILIQNVKKWLEKTNEKSPFLKANKQQPSYELLDDDWKLEPAASRSVSLEIITKPKPELDNWVYLH